LIKKAKADVRAVIAIRSGSISAEKEEVEEIVTKDGEAFH
jgi:hypothetical protein